MRRPSVSTRQGSQIKGRVDLRWSKCHANGDGKQPDVQISKNLSSPSRKNISLNPSGK
jgi:hypothetical protein